MPFTPIKKILESVMREKDFVENIEAYAIFARWGDIVGQNRGCPHATLAGDRQRALRGGQ